MSLARLYSGRVGISHSELVMVRETFSVAMRALKI